MVVTKAGRMVPLEPRAFDVHVLMANPDRVVGKDELLDTVWTGTFVTPNALTRAVAQLRKALADDAFEARYIETVSKRGYRFIAPFTIDAPAEADPAAAAPSVAVTAWTRRLAASGLLLVAVAAGWWAFHEPSPSRSEPPALAARQVTMSDGYNGELSISSDGPLPFPQRRWPHSWWPDGRFIDFAGERKGVWNLFRLDVETRSIRQLTHFTSAAVTVHYPANAPDANRLVFQRSIARSNVWLLTPSVAAPASPRP